MAAAAFAISLRSGSARLIPVQFCPCCSLPETSPSTPSSCCNEYQAQHQSCTKVNKCHQMLEEEDRQNAHVAARLLLLHSPPPQLPSSNSHKILYQDFRPRRLCDVSELARPGSRGRAAEANLKGSAEARSGRAAKSWRARDLTLSPTVCKKEGETDIISGSGSRALISCSVDLSSALLAHALHQLSR